MLFFPKHVIAVVYFAEPLNVLTFCAYCIKLWSKHQKCNEVTYEIVILYMCKFPRFTHY